MMFKELAEQFKKQFKTNKVFNSDDVIKSFNRLKNQKRKVLVRILDYDFEVVTLFKDEKIFECETVVLIDYKNKIKIKFITKGLDFITLLEDDIKNYFKNVYIEPNLLIRTIDDGTLNKQRPLFYKERDYWGKICKDNNINHVNSETTLKAGLGKNISSGLIIDEHLFLLYEVFGLYKSKYSNEYIFKNIDRYIRYDCLEFA